jgi:hypothetical protein
MIEVEQSNADKQESRVFRRDSCSHPPSFNDPTGSNTLNKNPICKGMDTTQDQDTTMDKDLYELHIWCHHDASSKPKLGKTHVTLFQERIRSPKDVHPSILGRQNKTNPSLLSLSTGTDLKKLPPLKTV